VGQSSQLTQSVLFLDSDAPEDFELSDDLSLDELLDPFCFEFVSFFL
jgi:hypothetical protein